MHWNLHGIPYRSIPSASVLGEMGEWLWNDEEVVSVKVSSQRTIQTKRKKFTSLCKLNFGLFNCHLGTIYIINFVH